MAREEDGFFDDLARGLADGTLTRGKALKLMGAAVVGGTLASLGIREASADRPGCKRAGKNCTRPEQCCGSLVCRSGSCQTPTTTTTSTPTTTTTETPTTTTSTSTTTPRPCQVDDDCVGIEECADGICQCPGCRDTNGVCQEGFSTSACGFAGTVCQQCVGLEFCAGICRCAGCYDAQGVCQTGLENNACGCSQSGVGPPCDVCGEDERCASCICEPLPPS